MSEIHLDHHALEKYLPHRGANLLLDTLTMNADRTSAISHTRITTNDARGRDIFGRKGPGGQLCWIEPFICELLAVTGVPLLHERLSPLGQVAVFSMISRVSFKRAIPMDADVIGHATITRDRGGFTVFSSSAEVNGETVVETEVMSGAADLSLVAQSAIRPLIKNGGGQTVDPGLFSCKLPAMRFIDRIVEQDPVAQRLVVAYHYPTNHPLVPGHFPQVALMMGMSQWTAIADAAWLARSLFGVHQDIVVNGTIKREDGSDILDVRDLIMTEEEGRPRIVSTKRLAFREPVRPGDGILVDITIKPA